MMPVLFCSHSEFISESVANEKTDPETRSG
jgi:hypothetical protein